MNGEDLADKIMQSVNSGIDEEEFVSEVQSSHNTLQRYAFQQVLKSGIQAIAGTPYTDQRNESVVEEAKEICEAMGWEVPKDG